MRILCVEDEHKIAAAITKGLEQENFAVDTAYDGTDGYNLASTEEYDLILLDLMLPKMSGLEICKKLRDQGIHTPVIMLTAKSETYDKIEGLNCGADDYITKPFSFDELLARIRAVTRRPKEHIDVTLVVDTLSINTNLYKVTRAGKEVRLSKKEYSLLEYMCRNKGRTLNKDQIISHVWSYESDILPNTVEQYVGYLRLKIDKAFPDEKHLIHTVRGFGYKIDV